MRVTSLEAAGDDWAKEERPRSRFVEQAIPAPAAVCRKRRLLSENILAILLYVCRKQDEGHQLSHLHPLGDGNRLLMDFWNFQR
jgi:hypothetical protein